MTGKQLPEQGDTMKEQSLRLENRSLLDLSGVIDVISFDDSGALIKTVNGTLAIDGTELRVTRLDVNGGCISLEGRINGLFFSDNPVKGKGKRYSG